MQGPSIDLAANLGTDAATSNLKARAERIARDAQDTDAKAADAGAEMEALFATLLVKEMRRSLPNQGFFGAGIGADTFDGWMDEFMGRELAEAGALELAGMVKAALIEKRTSGEETAR